MTPIIGAVKKTFQDENMSMSVYLDTCCIQRPFDDKRQLRISVESEIVLSILSLIEAGDVSIIASDILIFEVDLIANEVRKRAALDILEKSACFIEFNTAIEQRAQTFIHYGIKPIDALHLASAEEGGADFFCTCDDRFLNKAKGIDGLNTCVTSLIELFGELGK